MTRQRFYAPPSAFALSAKIVTLSPEETRHARDVLRLEPGDEVYVFDGEGREHRAAVDKFDRKGAVLNLLDEVEPARPESALDLILGIALIKGAKFDLVVQKATELGVHRLTPFSTARADVRVRNAEDARRKVTRWLRIALEATKQCGRARLIQIDEVTSFKTLIEGEKNGDGKLRLMFSERGGNSFAECVPGVVSELPEVVALIGPEGGWTDEEIALARAHDWKIVTLGGRTLRAETAGIVIAALLQHRFGDLV